MPIYDSSRFPKRLKRDDGSWGCRGCHGPIPKGRQSWCSSACFQKFDPATVIQRCLKNATGLCAKCGPEWKDWNKAYAIKAEQFHAKYPQAFHPLSGFSKRERRLWWAKDYYSLEADHIIPFALGGLTVDENMQALCTGCHKEKTRQDTQAFIVARKNQGDPPLLSGVR
jgi:5-methylcytosine-specific restriction endonuclease McrA